ncbi:MAG: HAMP domain-containing protein, partial [Ignavibacteriales bacterium]
MSNKFNVKYVLIIFITSILVNILGFYFSQGIISGTFITITTTLSIVVAIMAGMLNEILLIKPLVSLREDMRAVSKGTPVQHLNTTRNDELGLLQNSFIELTDYYLNEISVARSFQMGLHAGFFIADKNKTIISINDAVCKLMAFNKKPEEIIGKFKVKDILLQDSLTTRALNGEFIESLKVTLTNHNGQKLPALVQTGPIYNSKKELVAIFGFFEDLRAIESKQKEYLNEQMAPVAGVINKVANGDLTVSLELDEKSDLFELCKNINRMIGDLHNTLTMVNASVHATASAANEISSSSEQMASGSQEQTQQTMEVAGAVEQMTRTILDSTKNAN